MKIKKLVDIWTKINEIFPVPRIDDFKGDHAIMFMDNKLSLQIWAITNDKVKNWTFKFETEDMEEELNETVLLRMKENLIEAIRNYKEDETNSQNI